MTYKELTRKIIASSFIWSLLKSFIRQELCIPCYHVVNNFQHPHIKNLYPVINIKKFCVDLDLLNKNYDFITPEDLYNNIENGIIPKRKCVLTFDDGYRECYDVIYPILKRKGIPAIFFVNKDLIDNDHLAHFNKISLVIDKLKLSSKNTEVERYLKKSGLYQGNALFDIRQLGVINLETINYIGEMLEIDFHLYLKKHQPYLKKQQIREMHLDGFGIGAHSCNHQRFSELNEHQQYFQIEQSLEFIESITNKKTRFFAFPYSSRGFYDEIYNKFKSVLFFDNFSSFIKSDSTVLQRFIMDTNDNIRSRLIGIKLKRLRNKIMAK